MVFVHVLLLFLPPLQFNSDERTPVHFSTRGQFQSYCANPSQCDRPMTRQNSSLAINPQLIPPGMLGRSSEFVQCICRRSGSIVMCFGHPGVSSVCRPPAEVVPPLGCTKDQASSRPMIECSGRTAIQRVETAMLSPPSSAQSRLGVRNVPWTETGHTGRMYDSRKHRGQDIKEIRREKIGG